MTLLVSCTKGASEALKPVQQQKAGDYTISILTETGTMKQGPTSYTLEFRKTADNQLADVGTVEIAPVMDMPGMAPMMGDAEVRATDTAGRYAVNGKLSMSGLWKINVKFGDGQNVRFSLNAE